MDFVPGDVLRFHRHAEVEAELEQQFEKDVLLGAPDLEVLHGSFKALGEVLSVRVPLADVCGIELEDAETEVACEQRVFVFDFFTCAAQSFFG